RRNRGPVLAVSIILLCLLVGFIGTAAAMVWAMRERDDKGMALVARTEARDRALEALRDMTAEVVEEQLARGSPLTGGGQGFPPKDPPALGGLRRHHRRRCREPNHSGGRPASGRTDALQPRRVEGGRGRLPCRAGALRATGRRILLPPRTQPASGQVPQQ